MSQRPNWPAVAVGSALSVGGVSLIVATTDLYGFGAGIALALLGVAIIAIAAVGKRRLGSLLRLVKEGTTLLNADEDLAVLQLRASQWQDALETELSKAGATEREISDIRIVVSFEPVGPAASAAHANFKGMLAERLHRLRRIIERLDRE